MTAEELAAQEAAQAAEAAAAAASSGAGSTTTDQTQPVELTDETVVINGLTLAQVREQLGTLTTLQQAEQQRQTEAETARLAALSEQERVAEEAAAAARQRDEATTALETERTTANNLRLEIAIGAAARELNVQLHPTAIGDSLRLGDFSAVTFDEQRQPQGVKDALTELLKAKPYLQVRVDAPNLGGHDAGRDNGLTGAAAALVAQSLATTIHGF